MVRVPALTSLFAATLASLTGWSAPQAPAAQPVQGQRVFITGHSFHMPMIASFAAIGKAAKIDGHRIVGQQGLGGSTVIQHWNLPDDKDKARKAIKAGTVDVLTTAPNRVLPDEGITKFADLLMEHNPKGRLTVQASWYPYDGPDNDKNGGFKNARRDAANPADLRKAWSPWVEKMREQAKGINDKYKRQVVFVVPVGDAVLRLRERLVKGDVPGYAKQSELFTDDLGHAKVPVAVLTAYCHFAVIYGRSPIGLPVPPALTGPDAEKMNALLQECAWEAVLAEPTSGVKAAK